MIEVSEAWKEAHKKPLLPEAFVKISLRVGDDDVPEDVTVTADNEGEMKPHSYRNALFDDDEAGLKFATLEHNLWALDGSFNIPSKETYGTVVTNSREYGYVSADDSQCVVTLDFSKERTTEIMGFTIQWGHSVGEYPTRFKIDVKWGEVTVDSITITDNASEVSIVDLPVSNYDNVVITIYDWNLPDHRRRIDSVYFGHSLTFDKNDILSYSHESHGCVNSGELSGKTISFSLDNTDSRWNPHNPKGLGRFLSEQQKVEVKYGLNVYGAVEWITVGTFYLVEWKTSPNSLSADFVAKDVLNFLMNIPFTFNGAQGQDTFVSRVKTLAGELGEYIRYSGGAYYEEGIPMLTSLDKEYNLAEIIQMCANADGCVIYQLKEGVDITPLNTSLSDYVITSDLSYSHPEIELTKPLKAVSIKLGEDESYVLDVDRVGEIQSVENPLILTSGVADIVANWIMWNLRPRTIVSGDFRGDPRLEVFDIVTVESKFGTLTPVVITDLKYSYSGSFRTTYTGRIVDLEEYQW